VRVEYNQYYLDTGGDPDTPWQDPEDGLTTGEDDRIGVLTGTVFGPVSVAVVLTEAQPAEVEEGWDVIAERDLVNSFGSMDIRGPTAPAAWTVRLNADRYRIRVHARGRTRPAAFTQVTQPLETHLITLWPSPDPHPTVTRCRQAAPA
jgi:hypothetical protein